ncbi:polyphosphate polymerase domain-containing protein [bacterium]|nr:polyphosphate polymerase domain-containing protein [bacterium]
MSNHLSHTIRHFNRFELKYLLSLKQAEIFKKALRAYLVADEHDNGRYGLASLYYDSPDFRCYWEKVDGIRFRRKLRIRRYECDAPLMEDTPVFVEIKQRVDRVTQKRRVILPYGEALRLCNRRQYPEQVAAEDEAVVNEIYAYLWQYNLRPVSIVRYERQAFIGTNYDLGLRVTFDGALNYQVHRLRLEEVTSSLPMISPDRTVMEVKVNERIPYWLTEMIAAHNLKMIRISKYCHSIELANGHADTFSRLALIA